MDININLNTIYVQPYQSEGYTFIHFDSSFLLEQFIKINNKQLFGHKCCHGKGIKINNISNEELKSLKDKFLKNINNNFHKKKIGECSICYENKLIKNTICNHQFCYECLGSWLKIKKECPMCRAYLNTL